MTMAVNHIDSYFSDDSVIRRVHREYIVAFSGARALMMQSAHPVAVAGLLSHTGALDEPWRRLQRTSETMATITFGSREDADRATRRVRAIHREVRGSIERDAGPYPAGTPYAGDDPELLLWILATLADSALLVYQTYVGSLDRDERNAFWQDYRIVGNLFALEDSQMPDTIEQFEDYKREMLSGDRLYVTDQARTLAKRVVMSPPVPLYMRGMVELVNFIIVGLLPGELRRQFGFSWDPVRKLALASGAQYTKRVVVPLLPSRVRLVPSARAAA